ncbi:hypothetical protein OKW38_002753 [Paraburkholderia sp. MM5496-R1]|uniref:hypothetical protein n=1 Tax=Paraburkholderia sp. MM5496-R1 TaxID=2991065 RepID=UPI003D1D3C5D
MHERRDWVEKMATVDNSELERLRSLDALAVLDRLATHVKFDRDFVPRQSISTRRVHVNAAGADWELLVDGPRFYDTRADKGGGGAIDLVMYLWRVPFKKAVATLREVKT